MQDLKITLVQADLHWEEVDANLAMFEEKNMAYRPTDRRDHSARNVQYRIFDGSPQSFRNDEHENHQVDENGGRSNRRPRHGKLHRQRSRPLLQPPPLDGTGRSFQNIRQTSSFRMSDEHLVYSQGESQLIGHWKGWRICPLICYDLRFPVWSRNRWNATLKKPAYDLLVYVANWPQVRANAWDTLLRSRAIENLSYVAGVNRVGIDGKGIEYSGNSMVISPKGDYIFSVQDVEEVKTIQLNANSLQAYRDKFPALLDADDFNLEIGEYEEREFPTRGLAKS